MSTFNSGLTRRLAGAIAIVAATCAMQSCIDDSGIPYPDIKANFATFDVAFQERPARIDSTNRVLTVYLNDSADIHAVDVLSYSFSRPDAELADPAMFTHPIDLSDTIEVVTKVYREYIWRISATQTIERRFSVEGQIGNSDIDPATRTVTASIPSDMPISRVKVTDIKLGTATSTITPDIAGTEVDFSEPVKVTVEEFGRSSEWTITLTPTDLNVSIASLDAWSRVAWMLVEAKEGDSDLTVEYRMTGAPDWTTADASCIHREGAAFRVMLNGLEPLTEYEARAILGSETTAPRIFTTAATPQLPNRSFNDWWLDSKVWCPWAKEGSQFWDTGNKGASTLGQSNVLPIENEGSPTGYAGARLETRFIGVSVLGKLGAGSIFTGNYVRTDGTNGVLSFGRPFSVRPTRVRARIRYKSEPINYASSEMPEMMGRPDTCVVWCAISDRPTPYEIRTNPKNRQLFDPNDPTVVAYGCFESGESIAEFTDIEFTLDYRGNYSRRPKQIILVCAASKYGDYFTGGAGSTLEVENIELLYDY